MYDSIPSSAEPAPQPPRVSWGIREMVVCTVVVLVALFLITTVIVGPAVASYGDGAPETLVASAIANLAWNAAMIAAVLWFVRRRGGTAAELGLKAPAGREERSWPANAAYVVGFSILAYVVLNLLVLAYGVAVDALDIEFLEPDQQIPDDFYTSDVALAMLGVAVVGGAPFTEELFFRGFLFGGARPMIGVGLAAVITGFIFSLAHYNAGLVIPFTIVGAVLALSYYRTGTLYVPIGAHLLFNLISFSVLVFVPDARP